MSKVTKVVDSLNHNAGLTKELIGKDPVRQAETMIRETRGKVTEEVLSKKASDAIRASVTPQIKEARTTLDVNIVSKGLDSSKTRLDYFNKEFGGCVKSIKFDKAENKYIIIEKYKDGRIMTLRTDKDGVYIKLEDNFTGKVDDIFIPKNKEKNRKVMYIGDKDGCADLEILFAKDGVTIEEIAGAEAAEYQHLVGQKWDNKYLERHFCRPLNITAEEIAEYKKAVEEDKNLTLDYLGMVLPKIYQGKRLSQLDLRVNDAFQAREWYPDKYYQKAMDDVNTIMKHRNF